MSLETFENLQLMHIIALILYILNIPTCQLKIEPNR